MGMHRVPGPQVLAILQFTAGTACVLSDTELETVGGSTAVADVHCP